MKFYFQYQDDHRQKVATKCIRVSNTATVKEVIEVLVQKFRPDLRMLPNLSSYALYEVHDDEGENIMLVVIINFDNSHILQKSAEWISVKNHY